MHIDYSRLKDYEYRQRFYQSTQWRKLSEQVRKEEPLCQICLQEGLLVQSQCVDHIIDIEIQSELCLERSNLQALCLKCHNTKTSITRIPKKYLPKPLTPKEFIWR